MSGEGFVLGERLNFGVEQQGLVGAKLGRSKELGLSLEIKSERIKIEKTKKAI